MIRAGVLFAVVAFAVPVVAQPLMAPNRAQPTPPGPLLARLPAHLADKAVVAELKLDAEQVKEVRAVKFKAADPAAPEKLKEILKPEQYKRAVQLMAQDALRGGRGDVVTPAALVAVPGETFRRYPELADAAKLTREQRRRAATAGTPNAPGAGGLPAAVHVVLTPEQTAALTAFVGPVRSTPFTVFVPDRPSGGPTFGRVVEAGPTTMSSVPTQPLLMLAANNRSELKLSDEQAQTLQELVNTAYRSPPREAGMPPPTPESQQKRIADAEAKMAKTLSADQMKRLKQIELWQQVPPGSDELARFGVPRVAKALDLSAEQKADLKAVGKTHQDRAAAAFARADSADDLKTRLTAARTDMKAAAAKVLTKEQATALADLFGPEYKSSGPGGMQNDFGRKMRAAYFGCYQFELMVIGRFAGVPEDLKLTEEQKTGLTAAEREFNQAYQQSFDFDGPEAETHKKMAERSKAMQKVFDDHLNPDQRKRVVELSIQLRQQLNQANMGGGGGGGVMYPATAVPGIADALKLTPEQRRRIIDTGEEDEVMTAAQRAELKRLAGPALVGGFNFGGRQQSRPAQPSAKLGLLHAGTAHADLKLTPVQAYHIAEVIEEHAAEVRPVNPGRNPPEFSYVEPPPGEVVEDTIQACEKACLKLLTAPQRDRLGQLMLQASAHASLTAVFAKPDVTAKLTFTPAQRAKLDDIAADYRARVSQAATLPNGPGWQEIRATALKEMRETARDRLMAVLTDAQRAAWRELTGAPSPAAAGTALPTGPGPVPATRDP